MDGLLPVLFVSDAGVVDDDVQTAKLAHGALEGVCCTETRNQNGVISDANTGTSKNINEKLTSECKQCFTH